MQNLNSKALHNEQAKKRRRRKWYYSISLTLAAVVVFCTVYALILPAITMENQQQTLDCALDIHQHTDSCYDSAGNLICGEADYVIHTHDNKCFDANGKQVCLLPKLVAHKHISSCYNNKDELICELPEAEVHNHDELCYDKDGTLICGKLHTIEHVHGTACFRSSGTTGTTEPSGITNDESENGISPRSGAAGSARASANWGYNDDGSIWWGDLTVNQCGAAQIQENTAYIISGVYDNNLMSDQTTIIDHKSYLAGIKRDSMKDYTAFDRWYFEKRDVDGKYYVYFLSTNEDNSPKPLYLQFSDEFVSGYQGNRVYQTALTADKAQATAFTMEPTNNSDYPNHIILSIMIGEYKICLNSNADDPSNMDTYWIGYSGDSVGNYLKVCEYSPNGQNTANRVETDHSVNSVINLFDYWIAPNQTDPDSDIRLYDPVNHPELMEGGINNGHDFKFTMGTGSGSCDLNYWTQAGQLPRQGMVSKTLVDGFPVLSGNFNTNGTDSTESLKYLFDPTVEHQGKASYRNVEGLLTLNSEGYYSYNCKENMAEYNKEKKNIYVYDRPGVTGNGMEGQFFPFNNAPEVMTADRQESVINHYFGMTIRTRFVQRYNGFTDEKRSTPITFHFTGDDDVWVFIDDVLVGDLGGIHDAARLDIDFSTGAVKVSVPGSWVTPVTTTIRDCYKAAGKEDTVRWNELGNSNTFANNTTHSLKFFYLERGNNESNLELKFNLTEIPETAIDKTDEYGNPVAGAKFAVYAATGETETDTIYNMLDKKGGKVVDLSNEAGYDKHGNIIDSSGKIIANALYVGTTDSEGQMEFVDEDGMPYSLDDLEELFGKKFIVRETEAPEGYRMVSVDNYLRIYHGESQNVLISDNAEESGCRASTDLHTISTNTIYLRDKQNESQIILPATQYFNTETDTPNGTMFAVTVKYTGTTVGDHVIPDDVVPKLLTSTEYWTPIYGSDEEGYELVDKTGGKDFYAAAIEAAQTKVRINEEELKKELNEDNQPKYTAEDIEYLKYEGVNLQQRENGTMQLFMDDLPGHIRYYYNMLTKEKKNLTRYNVIYLWTNSSLEEANPDNTFVVNTRPAIIENGSDDIIYSGVERLFSAKIEIPNLINDLFVQKVDEKHTLIDGATFAMYRVEQQPNGQIHYLAKDANGAESNTTPTEDATGAESTTTPSENANAKEEYIALPEDAKPNADTGVIQVGDKTITPCYIDTTHTFEDGVHTGTVRFVNMPQGQYIVKEVKAPKGYNLNTTDIMVLVTDTTIYANAGTTDDGVIVGRGPGYLVDPLHSLAAEDDLNNTLTWVYAQMRITGPSTSFADAVDESKILGYVTKQNSSENLTTDRTNAFMTKLIYEKEKVGTIFNYVPDLDRYEDKNPTGKRRIFTDSGWPHYEIYQDYDYGVVKAANNNADYYNWSKKPITTLFSRTTYIRVTDKNDVTVKIKKVDSTNKTKTLADAQFRLYRMNSFNEKEYYVKEKVEVPQATTGSENPTVSAEKKYVETVSWSADSSKAFVVTTGDDGMSIAPTSPDPENPNKATSPEFTGLHDGTYYLEEIKAPSGYNPSPKPIEFTIKLAKLTYSTSSILGGSSPDEAPNPDDNNLYIYTVTVPNSTGFELPATGGRGTFMYTLGGILLIAFSLVFGYRRKRRSERRLN